MTTCPKCGKELVISEWPFCPHGVANLSIIDDQLEGGARWCETMAHEPVWLDGTKSQWKRLMDQHQVRNVGDRKPQDYFVRQRKMLDEQRHDTRKDRECR